MMLSVEVRLGLDLLLPSGLLILLTFLGLGVDTVAAVAVTTIASFDFSD